MIFTSFLKKLWKLYHNGDTFEVTDTEPTKDNLKTLHKTIKKVEEDIENFSFNTSVSTFMIAVNELTAQKCSSKAILEPLLILISPYAPHIAEELWQILGHDQTLTYEPWPEFDESALVESTIELPVQVQGKCKAKISVPAASSQDDILSIALAEAKVTSAIGDKQIVKKIVVPGRMVNFVVK